MANRMRLTTGLFGLFAVAALGGCGGGGTTAVPTAPTVAVSKTFGVVPSGALPAITYHPAASGSAEYYTVSGSSAGDLVRASGSDVDGFQAYTNGTEYLWVSSTSRDATARFGSFNSSSGKVAGSQYARISDGTVPTAGSATFTGKYGAVVVNSSGVIDKGVISGDVSLTANFGAGGSVTGTISNRVQYPDPNTTTGGIQLSDPISLNGATLDSGGNFANGTASGGKLNSSDLTTNGSYEGLIGANGTQVSGGVVITHTDLGSPGNSTTTETGAFIGDKP